MAMGGPLLETNWFTLDGVMVPVGGANISRSRLPRSGGRDPLLISNDRIPKESVDTQCKATGVEWKMGGGGRQMHSGVHVHLCSWS